MKNRKEKNKIKITLIIILSVLTLLLFLIQRNIKKESQNFPSKIEIIFEEKNEIYQKLMGGRKIIEEKYILSETEEKDISFEGKNISIIGIDENYSQINNIEIASGKWITGENQILISEKFVKETNDSFSLGETMDIFGKKYKIVGIYENDKYSKSKIENLYVKKEDIPENLGEGEKTFYSLEVKPKDENRKNFVKEKFFEDVKIISTEEQEEIKIADFTESKRNLSKYYYGFIFIFEIIVLILLTVYLIKSIKLNIKKYQFGTKRKYGKELLSGNMTIVLLQILKTLLLIFLWIFLLRLILEFKLSTPSRFLPPTDIFDFKFYSRIENILREEYGKTVAGYGKIYTNLMRVTKKYFIESVILLIALLSVSISYMCGKFKTAERKL
jgi:hypothetical protein